MPAVLSDALTSKVESLQEFAEEMGLHLECEIPEGLMVDTDPDLTLLVVEGLINTAFKQGCEGDKVKVAACADGKVTVDVLVTCAADAPGAQSLQGCETFVDPFLKMLNAELDITQPTPQSVLFSMQLPKAELPLQQSNKADGNGSNTGQQLPASLSSHASHLI